MFLFLNYFYYEYEKCYFWYRCLWIMQILICDCLFNLILSLVIFLSFVIFLFYYSFHAYFNFAYDYLQHLILLLIIYIFWTIVKLSTWLHLHASCPLFIEIDIILCSYYPCFSIKFCSYKIFKYRRIYFYIIVSIFS